MEHIAPSGKARGMPRCEQKISLLFIMLYIYSVVKNVKGEGCNIQVLYVISIYS